MRYKIQVKEELSHDLKINVSAGTVRRALRSNGLGALPKVKKPDISDDNAKERLLWCKDRIDWTLDDWKCIIFTDELRFGAGKETMMRYNQSIQRKRENMEAAVS
ncbi:hypothetical protein INT46_000126 [Mucor plumbeus]|uniref:Transposase Tc1-like domain-containing protein n=1 Tax=Mucor plumbeus TaxID=97098 RepID=A0A8H7UQ25_9FUNG|nr:hypothetical protein INT46_000126 [Mucor plumbeus]